MISEINEDKVVSLVIVNVASPIVKVPSVICSLKPESSAVNLEATEALYREFVDAYEPSSCLVKPIKEDIFELSVVAPILTTSPEFCADNFKTPVSLTSVFTPNSARRDFKSPSVSFLPILTTCFSPLTYAVKVPSVIPRLDNFVLSSATALAASLDKAFV